MKKRPGDERLITSYLLGAASELEQMLLETAYFHDAKYFELILAMEDELISNYVSGLMSTREREQFRQHFLKSARRRQRYEAVSELIDCVAQHPDLPKDCLANKLPAARPGLKGCHARQLQRWL